MIAGLENLWAAHADLENYWRNVYTRGGFLWHGAYAWNANMQDVKRRIDELKESGRLGKQVISGEMEPIRWKSVHKVLWDSVSSQAQVIGEALSAWGDFIVPTASEYWGYVQKGKQAVETVGEKLDFLSSPMGLLLVFGILLMAVVWKVA